MTSEAPEPLFVVRAPLALSALEAMAARQFGDLVKAVVDITTRTMVVGGELHSDEEAYLLDAGSEQRYLWGINLYPDQFGTEDFIEFDSMINLRPSQGNRSRSVQDAAAREAIVAIVGSLVHDDG